MSETFEQMAIRKWQEVCSSLSVGAPVTIKFAAAIRDELAKGAEPVAWMNSRNGFIAKENKNPEYNVGLYTCQPSAAARIAELEKQRDALLDDVGRCYRMLLSDPDTKGALFKAENILREAIAEAKEVAA